MSAVLVDDCDCINFEGEVEHFPAYTPVRYEERTTLINICGHLAIYGTGDYSRVVGEPVVSWGAPPDDCDLDDFEF